MKKIKLHNLRVRARVLIARKNVKKQDLAAELGISAVTLSYAIGNRDTIKSIEVLERIIEYLREPRR